MRWLVTVVGPDGKDNMAVEVEGATANEAISEAEAWCRDETVGWRTTGVVRYA